MLLTKQASVSEARSATDAAISNVVTHCLPVVVKVTEEGVDECRHECLDVTHVTLAQSEDGVYVQRRLLVVHIEGRLWRHGIWYVTKYCTHAYIYTIYRTFLIKYHFPSTLQFHYNMFSASFVHKILTFYMICVRYRKKKRESCWSLNLLLLMQAVLLYLCKLYDYTLV